MPHARRAGMVLVPELQLLVVPDGAGKLRQDLRRDGGAAACRGDGRGAQGGDASVFDPFGNVLGVMHNPHSSRW
jgi:hypothetical protein